jgi:uncharacterized protein (DUF427 family)
MKEKQITLPGPDHPISIQRNPARVVVSVAGRVVADTRNALTLLEAAYPPVQYIPGEDVDFSQLERTDHATYCPYKRRLQLLQRSRWREEVGQRGVVVRGSVSCC